VTRKYEQSILDVERLLVDPARELLWRQVTSPLWDEDNNVPASHAFGPSTSDEGRPSYARESVVTAQKSRDWHQKHARSSSAGVWAVSVQEVSEADVRAIDDSRVPRLQGAPEKSPGHCYVDFRGLSREDKVNARAVLLRRALARQELETTDIGFHGIEEAAA
jgi:hypothetical protein